MNQTLWRIGVVFVAFGVMFAIVPTGSYSTIAGERSVGVSVAADDSALVALVGTGNDVKRAGQSTSVGLLVNNLNSSATIEYEAQTDSDVLRVETASGAPTLQSGGEESLTVTCAPGSGGGKGTATLTVTVIRTLGSGPTITDATLTTTVSYDCPGGNQGSPDPAPDGSDAYTDSNNNGQYDAGEQKWTLSGLDGFDNESADIVLNTGGETRDIGKNDIDITASSVTIADTSIEGDNSDISITADTVTMTDTTFDVDNGEITITADTVTMADTSINGKNDAMSFSAESITMSGTTLNAKNAPMSLTSTTGDIDITGSTLQSEKSISITSAEDIHANQTVIETSNSDITLTADGDIFLRQAQLTTRKGNTAVTADLGSAASTLDVTGLEIEDKDNELVYSPSGITVVGTPSSGQVSS